MELSHIKAISFDGDMTLWDFEKVMRRSIENALAEAESVPQESAPNA